MALDVHPFRPFLDPWPPMAPKVPLNPGRRSFGAPPPVSTVAADENRPATRAELDAANQAIVAYADKLDSYDSRYRALYNQWWDQYQAAGTVQTAYTNFVYGPEKVDQAFEDWTQQIDATRATLAVLGDETLFGVSKVEGKGPTVTVGRLRQIYGFLASNAQAWTATLVTAAQLTPDATAALFWSKASSDAEQWARAFKELADGLRDLVAGVGALAQGAAVGIQAVSWIAPALVVAGVGFFLWLKASEARKRAGV